MLHIIIAICGDKWGGKNINRELFYKPEMPHQLGGNQLFYKGTVMHDYPFGC